MGKAGVGEAVAQAGSVPQRELGRTGEQVSIVGLGGFHIGKQSTEDESIRIVRAAIDAGINFIYTAPVYGDGGYGEELLAEGMTDGDGRCRLQDGRTEAGRHRLVFATGAWFAAQQRDTFYPEAVLSFAVRDPDQHHHVPLLLAPFAYSTYRGS